MGPQDDVAVLLSQVEDVRRMVAVLIEQVQTDRPVV
jgi:hypothetical protein